MLFDGCNSMLDGKFDQAWKVVDAEFLHQMAAVRLDGFWRQKENFCSFGVRLAFNEELKNLTFP